MLIEGTVIDGGQFGLLLKSSSQNGSCGEGCGTEHVTIRNSIIRNTRGGVNTNRSEGAGAVEMHDILFDNVLFEDIGPSSRGWRDGEGRMFQILGATSGLTIRNVTYDTDGHSYLFPVNARQPKGRDFTYDNVVVNGTFRYRMLVQQPRAFQGHYETYEFGTAYGNCGNAPVPLTCFRSIPPEAGADMERIRAATAGVVP